MHITKTKTGLIAISLLLAGCTATSNANNSAAANALANTATSTSTNTTTTTVVTKITTTADGTTTTDSQLDPRIAKNPRTLAMFKPGYNQCYDRNTEPYTFVVDSHNHFRPFGGNAVPMTELAEYFRRLGVLFVNVYGIGQTLPVDSGCEYYGDCPGVQVEPSIKNDFRNASNYLEFAPSDLNFTLSMSFPDLANPEYNSLQIQQLDKNYSGMFKWMGEVNLVKQALFPNGRHPTPIEAIKQWDFMPTLKERNIPIAIHSDLGSDAEPTKYLYLMDEVLRLYPDNKIVWVHMGLSKELSNIDPAVHIPLLEERLDNYPNLMLDITWRVIYDNYFSKPTIREQYVTFLNKYSNRILPGTDFVASREKSYEVYAEEVQVNSQILLYLDNAAFRNIGLGQNYFDLMGLSQYTAPQICP